MTDGERFADLIRDGVKAGLADFFDIAPDDHDARRAIRAWVGRLVRKDRRNEQWSAVFPIEFGKLFLAGLGSLVLAILGWLHFGSGVGK